MLQKIQRCVESLLFKRLRLQHGGGRVKFGVHQVYEIAKPRQTGGVRNPRSAKEDNAAILVLVE
jgi:hypothetical protein